jgi:hypothetical protein
MGHQSATISQIGAEHQGQSRFLKRSAMNGRENRVRLLHAIRDRREISVAAIICNPQGVSP